MMHEHMRGHLRDHKFGPKFLGVTKVSDKGQVVIPAEAREAFDLKQGDKLVVIAAPGRHGLLLVKSEQFDKHLNFLTKKIEDFQKISEELKEEE